MSATVLPLAPEDGRDSTVEDIIGWILRDCLPKAQASNPPAEVNAQRAACWAVSRLIAERLNVRPNEVYSRLCRLPLNLTCLFDSPEGWGAASEYPSKKVGGRELTPEEYDQYQEMAGGLSHDWLTSLVTSPQWRTLDPEERTKAAKKMVDGAREVTPDEAGRVMALLTAHKLLVQTGDHEARILALEEEKK